MRMRDPLDSTAPFTVVHGFDDRNSISVSDHFWTWVTVNILDATAYIAVACTQYQPVYTAWVHLIVMQLQ